MSKAFTREPELDSGLDDEEADAPRLDLPYLPAAETISLQAGISA